MKSFSIAQLLERGRISLLRLLEAGMWMAGDGLTLDIMLSSFSMARWKLVALCDAAVHTCEGVISTPSVSATLAALRPMGRPQRTR